MPILSKTLAVAAPTGLPVLKGQVCMEDAILQEQRPAEGVALLRLNRPAVLNALNLALPSEVVPDAEVLTRATALARQLAAGPQHALQAIKEAVIAGMNLPLEQGLQFERKCFQLLFATADQTEGMRARLDKRAPTFSGH